MSTKCCSTLGRISSVTRVRRIQCRCWAEFESKTRHSKNVERVGPAAHLEKGKKDKCRCLIPALWRGYTCSCLWEAELAESAPVSRELRLGTHATADVTEVRCSLFDGEGEWRSAIWGPGGRPEGRRSFLVQMLQFMIRV